MVDIGKLMAGLGLDNTPFIKAMRDAETQMNTSAGKMSASWKRVGDQFETTGRAVRKTGQQLSLKLTAPLVALGGMAIKTGMDFQASMNQVAAVSGATGKEFDSLKSAAEEMGRTTKFTATESADALNFLAMAGFSVQESLQALPSTLTLAAAGNMQLGESADIVSNIMQGFGLSAEYTEQTVDQLTKTFTSSNTSLSQLGEAMSYAAPIAKAFGQDITTSAAAVGILSDAGMQGSRAGTGLGQVLVQLNKKASEVGITVNDAAGNMKPLADIIEEIEKKGLSGGEMIDLLGQRAGPAMANLLERGSGALREFAGEIEDSGGIAQRVADKQMEGLKGALTELRSALSGLAIAFSDLYTDGIERFVDRIKGMVQWLNETDETTKRWIASIGAVLAVMGPLLMVVGQMSIWLGATIKLVSGLSGAMGGLVTVKKLAIKVQLAWNAAITANPLGVFIMVLAAAAAGVYALSKAFAKQTEEQKALQAVQKQVNRETREEAAEVDLLRRVIENHNVPLERRKKAIEELKEIVPGYLGQLTEEGRLINHNTLSLQNHLTERRNEVRLAAMRDREKELAVELQKETETLMDLETARALLLEDGLSKGSEKMIFLEGRIDAAKQAVQEKSDAVNRMIEGYTDLEASIASNTKALARNNEVFSSIHGFDMLTSWEKAMVEVTSATDDSEKANKKLGQSINDIQAEIKKYEGEKQSAIIGTVEFEEATKNLEAAQRKLKLATGETSEETDLLKDEFTELSEELAALNSLMGDEAALMQAVAMEELKDDVSDAADEFERMVRAQREFKKYGVTNIDDYLTQRGGAPEPMEGIKPKAVGPSVTIDSDFSQYIAEYEAYLGEAANLNGVLAESISGAFGKSFTEILDQSSGIVNQLTQHMESGASMTDEAVVDLLEKLEELGIAWDAQEQRLDGVANAIGTIFTDLTMQLGNLFVDTEKGFKSMVSTALSGISSIIRGLLQEMMVLKVKAILGMVSTEASTKGLPGLLLAGVGIGIIEGLWAKHMADVPKMRMGGVVPPGFPNDTYPALLTSGEQVTPAPKPLDNNYGHGEMVARIEDAGPSLLLYLKEQERRMSGV